MEKDKAENSHVLSIAAAISTAFIISSWVALLFLDFQLHCYVKDE